MRGRHAQKRCTDDVPAIFAVRDRQTGAKIGIGVCVACSPVENWGAEAIPELYRLRWQIELVNNELKQHLALESVPTKDPNAAQVFGWASLLALDGPRDNDNERRKSH